MKVVRQISTGDYVYWQRPDFKDEIGIINAHRNKGIAIADLEEVEVTSQQVAEFVAAQKELEKDLDKFNDRLKAVAKVLFAYIKTPAEATTLAKLKADIKSQL